MRFALSPDKLVTPDLRCKLPGRGVWLSANKASLAEALKKKLFARSFRQEVSIADDFMELVQKLTRNDALRTLSLANKAGVVITGYEKIKRALDKGEITWLLHAIEASSNGSDKLDRYFTKDPEKGTELDDLTMISPVLSALFTGDELSLALGGPNVIHIGMKKGEMARRFAIAVQKVESFQPLDNKGPPIAQTET